MWDGCCKVTHDCWHKTIFLDCTIDEQYNIRTQDKGKRLKGAEPLVSIQSGGKTDKNIRDTN